MDKGYEWAIFEFLKLLLSKWGFVQDLSCENEFHLHENKKNDFLLMVLHLASLWNRG